MRTAPQYPDWGNRTPESLGSRSKIGSRATSATCPQVFTTVVRPVKLDARIVFSIRLVTPKPYRNKYVYLVNPTSTGQAGGV